MSRTRISVCAAGILLLASCKGEPAACTPTDPFCSGGGGTTVSSILVTSSADTVVALSRTPQMTAVARDASNNPLATQPSFTWISTVTGTATVSSSGLVTPAAAGSTTIQATSGTVTGNLGLRFVNANLPLVTTLVADDFAAALRAGLSATPQGQMNTLIGTCGTHVTSGNVRALDACLTNLSAVTGGNGNDTALLAVLDLFYDHARRQLALN